MDLLRKIVSALIVCFLAIGLAVSLLSVLPKKQYKYSILFEESVSGLAKHAQVYVGSVPSGHVDLVKNDPENPNHSIVIIGINDKIDPKKAVAGMVSKNLIGSQNIVQIVVTDVEVPLNRELNSKDLEVLGQIAYKSSASHSAYSMFQNIAQSKEVENLIRSASQSFIRLESILKKVDLILSDDSNVQSQVKDVLVLVKDVLRDIHTNFPSLVQGVGALPAIMETFNTMVN